MTNHDLTGQELKQVRSKLEEAIREIEDRTKRQYSEIAHEINNPLHLIMGSISCIDQVMKDFTALILQYQQMEGLREHPHYEELKEFEQKINIVESRLKLQETINIVKRGCGRINEITANLRLQAQGTEAEDIEVNINESIETALLMLPESNKIKIYKQLNELPLIKSKKGKFVQVFINLIKNAQEAILEKEKLEDESIFISSNCKQDEITVRIKDTGVGMGSLSKEKLFDEYYSTKGVNKQRGIGMQIVKEIIKSQHGSLQITSELGRGTEVLVNIPYYQIR